MGQWVKNLPAMQEITSSVPELGRFPGGGNGNPLQYYYLENSMDRGAWQAIVPGVTRVRHDLATKQQEEKISRKDISNTYMKQNWE